jgi:hypothetical protein
MSGPRAHRADELERGCVALERRGAQAYKHRWGRARGWPYGAEHWSLHSLQPGQHCEPCLTE